jgi:hypothetical protein
MKLRVAKMELKLKQIQNNQIIFDCIEWQIFPDVKKILPILRIKLEKI